MIRNKITVCFFTNVYLKLLLEYYVNIKINKSNFYYNVIYKNYNFNYSTQYYNDSNK